MFRSKLMRMVTTAMGLSASMDLQRNTQITLAHDSRHGYRPFPDYRRPKQSGKASFKQNQRIQRKAGQKKRAK